MNTNKDAEDFKVSRCSHKMLIGWEDFIPAKEGTLIGGLIFLKDWIIRSEVSDALVKNLCKKYKNK